MTKLFWREIAGAAIKLTNQVTLLNKEGKEWTLEHRNKMPLRGMPFYDLL